MSATSRIPASPQGGSGNDRPPTATELSEPADVLRRRKLLRFGLPIAVLALAFGLRWLLYATSPSAATAEPEPIVPVVRVVAAMPETLRLEVVAHGTVSPRTESDLVAEVRGRVVSVSPKLEAGAFFDQGDELLRLDGREPAIALDRARARVRLRASEAKLAESQADRRRTLAQRNAASVSDLDQFESRADVAAAALQEAKAQLAQAELDLERTTLRAPYDGRVRERHAHVGQFVSPGTTLARIYAVDYAEVRLPIQTRDLAYLVLPEAGSQPSPVMLEAELSGQRMRWPAVLARSEGSIDAKTRMLYVVARIDDPQARRDPTRQALPAGLFVRAVVQGRELQDVYRLPALALRDDDRVFIVGSENQLHSRSVDVARRTREEVILRAGLEPGERVIVSPLRAVTEGMQVRTVRDGAPETDGATP